MSGEPREQLSADQLRQQLLDVQNELYFLVDMFGLTEKQEQELRRNIREHYELHFMLARNREREGKQIQ